MAQTTGAMTLANCKIYIHTTSVFPTSALSLSDAGNEIAVSGGELTMVEAFTFGTGTPILAPGNKAKVNLKIKMLYTEVVADGYTTIAGWYENKTPVYIQYIPKGIASTGVFTFTSTVGYITTPPYASGNAVGDEFATYELSVDVQSITRGTLA